MQKAVIGFVSRLPNRVSDLLMLSDAGNLDELRRMIHQLKGAGAGYGFPTITQTAARAEASIKASAGIETIKSQLDELIELIRGIQGYDRTIGERRRRCQGRNSSSLMTRKMYTSWCRSGSTVKPLEFLSSFNGEQGLALAQELLPDLILLDVDLPGLDGFEVCRQLKALSLTADIPVIFLTGASLDRGEAARLGVGCHRLRNKAV